MELRCKEGIKGKGDDVGLGGQTCIILLLLQFSSFVVISSMLDGLSNVSMHACGKSAGDEVSWDVEDGSG